MTDTDIRYIDPKTIDNILDSLIEITDRSTCTYEEMLSALHKAEEAVNAAQDKALKQRGDKIAKIAEHILYYTMTKSDFDFIKEAYANSIQSNSVPSANQTNFDLSAIQEYLKNLNVRKG